jgi:hypothetical protein
MTRTKTGAVLAMAAFLGAALPWTSGAVGKQRTLKEQLVGAWEYVSVDTVRPDGSRVAMYGPHPLGIAIFDRQGHYALVNTRADLQKFASSNRTDGTADEYKAVVLGSIAHFGTYDVDEAGKTITFRIQASTFANWNGVEQKRPFTLAGDQLRWTTPAASGGGSGEVVLKRAR